MEDWTEIRRLYRADGMAIRAIARKLGIGRKHGASGLASDGPPKYERRPAGPIVDGVEPQIRALLAQRPRMPVPVTAVRLDRDH